MAPSEPQKIRLDSLDAKDLSSIQQQLQEELQALGNSSLTLQKAAGELGASGRAIERLGERKEESADNVLVDLGTGYYAEKSLEEGAQYFKRKVTLLKDELDKIGQVMADKQRINEQVAQALRRKAAAAAPSKS